MKKASEQDKKPMACINVKGLILMLETMRVKYVVRDYNLAAGNKRRTKEDKLRHKQDDFDPLNGEKFEAQVTQEISKKHKIGYQMQSLMMRKV